METKELEGGRKRVAFARTPVMSTYLLAFVVGEFDHVEERDEGGLLIRVFTPVGKADKGRFALSVSWGGGGGGEEEEEEWYKWGKV